MFSAIAKCIQRDLGYKGTVINMQYFVKHPNYKITAPHQDGAYFEDNDSDILTFWIPLHSVSSETSTMFYHDWDGKREIVEHKDCGKNNRTRTGKTGVSQYTDIHPLEDFTPVDLMVIV
jgi:ectoine hydroxylase-related dioxygenase (phytanoyl-CoA dioxygenase family)